MTVLGEYGGAVHEWPDDQDYLPAFIDVHGLILPRLTRGVDEQSRPKPLQLIQTAGAAFVPSAGYFRIALEEKPTDPSILSNYGNWLKERGELDAAEAAYRKAIASDDSFANAHGDLALLLDDRGDIDDAEREHRRAVELDRASSIWAANLAFFLWHRRDEQAAGRTLLEEAVNRQRDAFTLGRLARFTDVAIEDRDAARDLYEEALALAPDDVWIHGRFANFLQRAGESYAARERFERAVSGEHPDIDALLENAVLQAREGLHDSAAELLRRLLKLRPRHPDALAILAATHSLRGADAADVERMNRQVLKWQPSHSVAALNLAQLLLRRDSKDEEARELLRNLDDAGLLPELRLERLFYALAYCVEGFEEAPEEIRRLLEAGERIPSWDLSVEVAAARLQGHPHADLLAQVQASTAR